MHELGLCASIVDAVEKRAGERPVARVKVRAGRLLHVHRDAFDQSFALAAEGTVAAGAEAELELVGVQARCGTCSGEWEGDDIPLACPRCGSVDVRWSGGDELVLESLEYRG